MQNQTESVSESQHSFAEKRAGRGQIPSKKVKKKICLNSVIGPNFRFGPMSSAKTFTEARDRRVPLQHFFGRMPRSFSIGFRWSVGRLKGSSACAKIIFLIQFIISFISTAIQSLKYGTTSPGRRLNYNYLVLKACI